MIRVIDADPVAIAACWRKDVRALPAPEPDEIRAVAVDAEGALLGGLVGRIDAARGLIIHGLAAERADAIPLLLARAQRQAARVEVCVDEDALLPALTRAGFRLAWETVHVERSLAEPPVSPLRLLRARQLGAGDFHAAVAAALVGTRNRYGPRDASALLDDAAGGGLAHLWSIGFAGDDPVGVLVPRAGGRCGQMALIGVLPAQRGRGHGKALLALGLADLAAAGLTHYRDRTDVLNEPMWRAFAALGCHFTAHRRTFTWEG